MRIPSGKHMSDTRIPMTTVPMIPWAIPALSGFDESPEVRKSRPRSW